MNQPTKKPADIGLTQGRVAIVDAEDVEKLSPHHWHVGGQGYVHAQIGDKKVMIHRFILNLSQEDKRRVDHINRNRLDNRKENLRLCTYHQNQGNRTLSKNNKSGFMGVCWKTVSKMWVAQIHRNGKMVYLGSSHDKLEAAKLYNKAAKEYFGEFARFNDVI